MDEIFNVLTSSVRLDKSRQKKKQKQKHEMKRQSRKRSSRDDSFVADSAEEEEEEEEDHPQPEKELKSRDRRGKRDTSEAKLKQVQKEQMAAFRRSMNIRINSNKEDAPDAISQFQEICVPSWLNQNITKKIEATFQSILRPILYNIETGLWKEPTPIQMQVIPSLLERRDVLASAPTGSGKSGAFILPALILSTIASELYHGTHTQLDDDSPAEKNKKQKLSRQRHGQIRCLLLAPSRELASQLHREVQRLGMGKPGGITSLLLTKSNSSQTQQAGGAKGLDVLVTTPLRLVDAIQTKGLVLEDCRLVVLDEADRLLDASDQVPGNNSGSTDAAASGSSHTQTFLSQMDTVLSHVPTTATRALLSATVTPAVRSLSDSILRNGIDITVASTESGGANKDIDQRLMFVGREEGKLLAIRQLVARGGEGCFTPPLIVFCQSQERAQALFLELLYDQIRVDVLHAGRSQAAREQAVAKFRKGETWVLISTDLVARGVDFRAVNMVINYDLPTSGVTYVHRIGRTGRAGRKGKAITFFTEADFENLRAIANVMKQSGCDVPDWMLSLKKSKQKHKVAPKRAAIDTTPWYDKVKHYNKMESIRNSKRAKAETLGGGEKADKWREDPVGSMPTMANTLDDGKHKNKKKKKKRRKTIKA